MDKGIRPAVVLKFNELVPTRTANGGTVGDTQFRKNVIVWAMDQFSCTLQAASTHYNFAKKEAEKATPTLVVGLGRAPDKNNGGRKKKAEVPTLEVAASATPGAEVAGDATTGTASAEPAGDAALTADIAAALGVSTDAPAATVNVYKAKDNSLVQLGITQAEAEELVAKAAKAKKGALYIADAPKVAEVAA